MLSPDFPSRLTDNVMGLVQEEINNRTPSHMGDAPVIQVQKSEDQKAIVIESEETREPERVGESDHVRDAVDAAMGRSGEALEKTKTEIGQKLPSPADQKALV
jgi:hypothetical protein